MAKKDKKIKVDDDKPQPQGMLEKIGIKDGPALAAQIQKDFNSSEQTKWLWIPERNLDVKNYYGVIQSSEWPFKGASRIKSQFQRIVVDTMAANIVKSIFLPEHPIRVNPAPLDSKSSDETLDNIKYVEDLHNSLQANEYNLHQVLDKALPTSLIESFVILTPVYEYLTEEIILTVKRWVDKDVDPDTLTYDLDTDTVSTKDGQTVHSINLEAGYVDEDVKTTNMKEVTFDVEKETCVHDGIKIKMINGYRFYMPIGTPGETPYEKIQNAPYCVHQLFYTLREVMQYAEQGYFEQVDIVMNGVAGQDQRYKTDGNKGKPIIAATVYDRQRELLTYTKLIQAGFLLDTARLEYEYAEVLKWFGKWKINGKWQELIVWMDRSTLTILRVERNIFGERPLFPVVPFPIDETPYGESLCKIIRPLVQELDLLLRTITNIALMKSAPPKFFDPASGFNPATIGQFGPNSWIPAREPARNVLIPPQPEDPKVAMEMVQLLINFIERITGISETVQGQIKDRANTTATEVQTALMRSGVRFDQVYERIKDQLRPMFRYIHKLTLRYMPPVKEVRLMGADNAGRLAKIYKEKLKGNFAFELSGNSIVTEQNELQNALALYNTIGQHPYVTYKPESIYYILYNIVKRLNPIAMDKILPTPDEVKELERTRAQTDAQAAQQGGGNPEVQAAQQKLQMEAAGTQQKLQQSQAEHSQKLQHIQEKHALEMAVAQQKLRAQQQQAEVELMQMKARAHAQAESTGKKTPTE